MYVQELGEGEAVLLLHGTPSPASDWLPVAERLASRYRVLVPDLPGYGRSPLNGPSTIDGIADELVAMLHERSISSLLAIAGFSSGVYRALHLVVRREVKTRVIVALSGFATLADDARAVRAGFAKMLRDDPSSFHGAELRGAMPQTMLSPAWRKTHPEDIERVTHWLDLTTPEALASELESLAGIEDLRPHLRSLDPYVYVRVGELDTGAPPAWSEDIAFIAPHTTFEMVPSVGHALLIEDLATTTAAILHEIQRAD